MKEDKKIAASEIILVGEGFLGYFGQHTFLKRIIQFGQVTVVRSVL